MITLSPQNVRLNVRATNKHHAIRLAGEALVKSGAIAPGYIDSMLGREQQANTYLGNGIAIPHGQQKDRELIEHTAVSVIQIPDGVEWNPGQTVRLVVGIAARSDEHISILAALTDVLDDPAAADRLVKTRDVADIIAALTRSTASSATPVTPDDDDAGWAMVEVTIIGQEGLHARPATVLTEVARIFTSEIQLCHGAKRGNAKSLASLLKLGIAGGSSVQFRARGSDAAEALAALSKAVEAGLGEMDKEPPAPETASVGAAQVWAPASEGHMMGGISASPGIAIGRIVQFQTTRLVVRDEPKTIPEEDLAFRQALAQARTQISSIYNSVTLTAGKAEAAIFRAHLALLSDEELSAEVLKYIDMGHSAAWSWQTVIDRRVTELQELENERLVERAADLHDVGQRVLRQLAGTEHGEARLPEGEPVILIADDLLPSDTARLDPARILGLCTASGGPTSHTAIIARSLDIPAVVGAGPAILDLKDGSEVILEATAGKLYVAPTETDIKSAREFHGLLQEHRDTEHLTRYQPAILRDGARIEIAANIGKASEAAAAVEAGAEGVGLLRTEFLFLHRETSPTEDEQFAAYSEMIRALNGLPLIIRTLDIGGDKVVPYLSLPHEENPFLGVRGVRLCLRQPEIFLPQLRAVYRASALGPVKIMFPMVSTLEELRSAKELAEQVRQEIGVAPVEFGIMVEVPSTVVMAAEFAREVDFFSVGTNDLTQYTMAMDRLHATLARNVDGLHPAVLRMIETTVRGAKSAGKWVGVCGGIAGDPLGAVILAGLGVAELSMTLPSIAGVKSTLRKFTLAETKSIAEKALACTSSEEVRQLLLP